MKNLDKYSCNFCKSKKIILEWDSDGRDCFQLIKCQGCEHYLSIVDLERNLLKEEIKDIPGFICLLSSTLTPSIILHAKNDDDKYPKEWGGFKIKLIDHSKEKDHYCKFCSKP